MERKFCIVCNNEKQINKFYNKFSECEDCNIKKGVKRYYDIKDKISIQRKLYYEKNRGNLSQKQNDIRNKINTDLLELHKSHVELQNRLKALEELTINDSNKKKQNKIFINELCSKPPKKNYPTNKTDVYYIDDIWSLDI